MGEQVVEMVKGASMLKLWAAPKLRADGSAEESKLVDVAVDGWVLGPLHVADYDPMSTLRAMSSVGTAPPGWGAVSLYGQGLGLRSRPGGTREQLVEEGKRAAMVMWEYVLQHVVARVGRDEVAVVEALRAPVQGQDRTLGELMVEVASAITDEFVCVDRLNETRLARDAAVEAHAEAMMRVNGVTKLIGSALDLPLDLPAGEVPDAG